MRGYPFRLLISTLISLSVVRPIFIDPDSDVIFSPLRLWQDSSRDGISEAGELFTLPSLGVSAIDLDYKEKKKRDGHGNWFRYRAKVYDLHGSQLGRWAWDVFLTGTTQ